MLIHSRGNCLHLLTQIPSLSHSLPPTLATTNLFFHVVFCWLWFLSFFFFFFFGFLGPHLQHMKVPRLGSESELQLPAYPTATSTLDLSHICDLHHSSQQHWIPNPLRPGIEAMSSRILVGFVNRWATSANPKVNTLNCN